MVHIVRDFSNVSVQRYNEAISKQLVFCPKIAWTSAQGETSISTPAQNNTSSRSFSDISKDLFDFTIEEEMIEKSNN